MRVVLPQGTERVLWSLLFMQIAKDPYIDYDFSRTVQALLWACCSPHDFGMPQVFPLWEARLFP